MSILKKLSVTTAGAAFIALGMLSMGEAKAVTLNPDAFGYTANDEIPFTFKDIATTGIPVLKKGNDNSSAQVSLSFNFNFYGKNYDKVSLSSNGLMSFGGTNNTFSNVNFKTQAPIGNLASVAPFWDDLILRANPIYYQTLGTEGERLFVAQWDSVAAVNSKTNPINFQVVLFEGTNDILFSYVDVETGNSTSKNGGSATVGIRDVNGNTNNRNLQWSFNSPVLTESLSICFSTSGCTSVPVPFEFSPGLGILSLGACWGAIAGLNSLVQKQKSSISALSKS